MPVPFVLAHAPRELEKKKRKRKKKPASQRNGKKYAKKIIGCTTKRAGNKAQSLRRTLFGSGYCGWCTRISCLHFQL